MPKYIEQLPKSPKGLFSWIQDKCVEKSYIVFSLTEQKAVCTRCGKKHKLSPSFKDKHNEESVCKHCKVEGLYKNQRFGRKGLEEHFRVLDFVRKEKTLYAVVMEINASFTTLGKPQISKRIKQIFVCNKTERKNYFFHDEWCFGKAGWVERKNMNVYRPNGGAFHSQPKYINLHVYDENWKGLFEKTDCKYMDVEQTFLEWELTGEELIRYIAFHSKYPKIENLRKFGARFLILGYIDDFGPKKAVNWKGATIQKMMRCTLFEATQIKECNLFELQTWSEFKQEGITLSSKATVLIQSYYGRWEEEKKVVAKVAEYLANQEKQCGKYVSIKDYLDYKIDCEILGYDWDRKKNKYPLNFQETHLQLARKREERENKVSATALKRAVRSVKNKGVEFEFENLFVRVAENQEEIKMEGRILEHCVAGYVGRMVEKKCYILFLRKKTTPEESFYTVELDEKFKIIQCRGKNNCQKTEEVERFLKEWDKHRENIAKAKKKIA